MISRLHVLSGFCGLFISTGLALAGGWVGSGGDELNNNLVDRFVCDVTVVNRAQAEHQSVTLWSNPRQPVRPASAPVSFTTGEVLPVVLPFANGLSVSIAVSYVMGVRPSESLEREARASICFAPYLHEPHTTGTEACFRVPDIADAFEENGGWIDIDTKGNIPVLPDTLTAHLVGLRDPQISGSVSCHVDLIQIRAPQ